MSSKPDDAAAAEPSTASPFPGGVLEVEGRDAGSFLQSQLMNDVAALSRDGEWQWNGWLSAKGRVLALGALLRLSEQRYWLVLPDLPPATLAAQLRVYVFRSRVQLRARDDLALRGYARSPAALGVETAGALASMQGERIAMDWSGALPRVLILAPASESQPWPAGAMTAAEWTAADIAHGLPRLAPTEARGYTPQMLGLARLRAYSVKKGCYPGQEIVARTHYLGQAKREAKRLRSATPLAPGASLTHAGAALGEVLCSSACADGSAEAIAVLPVDSPSTLTLAASGEPVDVIGFEVGLAR